MTMEKEKETIQIIYVRIYVSLGWSVPPYIFTSENNLKIDISE